MEEILMVDRKGRWIRKTFQVLGHIKVFVLGADSHCRLHVGIEAGTNCEVFSNSILFFQRRKQFRDAENWSAKLFRAWHRFDFRYLNGFKVESIFPFAFNRDEFVAWISIKRCWLKGLLISYVRQKPKNFQAFGWIGEKVDRKLIFP